MAARYFTRWDLSGTGGTTGGVRYRSRFREGFAPPSCSTVLLHLTRTIYDEDDCPAVFNNTTLEYPGIVEHVKRTPGVIIVRPEVTHKWVIENHGYPVVSKRIARMVRQLQNPTPKNEVSRRLRLTGFAGDGRYMPGFKLPDRWKHLVNAPFKVSERCCDFLKKAPLDKFLKERDLHPMLGTMASESSDRERQWLRTGCTVVDSKFPHTMPLAIWTEQDILEYIVRFKVPYASVYGDIVRGPDGKLHTTGEKRTGCVFCGFGAHLEPIPNRFQRMQTQYPRLWDHCINRLGCGKVFDYMGIPYKAPPGTYTQHSLIA